MRKNRYTIFTIKKDALKRKIANYIIKDIKKFYEIIILKKVIVSPYLVNKLKEYEWSHNWKPYPSEEIKQLSHKSEAGRTIVLLCRIRNDKFDAIKFGNELKGNHHLPHLCEKDTIRGKYADFSTVKNIFTDSLGVSYICNKNGKKISLVPNIIHAVDNKNELKEHIKVFFGEFINKVDELGRGKFGSNQKTKGAKLQIS